MGGESIPIGRNIDGRLDSTRARPTYLEVLYRWIFTVDHKKLGILYISYGLLFMLVAGVEALMIRIQLFFPHNTFVSLFVYNRLFTMHGTTMVFFVGMPLIFEPFGDEPFGDKPFGDKPFGDTSLLGTDGVTPNA